MSEKQFHVSPSQLSTAFHEEDGCLRKWGFSYISGLKTPATPAMQFGTEVHAYLEPYLRAEDLTQVEVKGDVKEVARQAFKYLPLPGPTNQIETKMEIPIEGGVLLGYIDVMTPRAGDSAAVYDHKTTKDLRYAKTEDELRKDFQAIIYSYEATRRYPLAKTIRAQWNWIGARTPGKGVDRPRKPRGVRPVVVEFETGWLAGKMDNEIIPQSERLIQLRQQAPDPNELKANNSACYAYGGCPFRDKECKRAGGSSLDALFNQHDKSHKTKLTKDDNVSSVSTDDKLNLESSPEGGNTVDLFSKLTAMQQEQDNGGDPLKTAELGESHTPAVRGASLFGGGVEDNGGVEEDVDTVVTEAEDIPHVNSPEGPAAAADLVAEKKNKAAAKKGNNSNVVKKGRGRPPGAKNKRGTKPSKPVAEVQGSSDGQPGTENRQEGQGLTILIDCLPTKSTSQPRYLGEVLNPVAVMLAEHLKIPHWKSADFGKGPGLLAVAFGAWLNDNPLTGVWMMDSFSAESQAVMELMLQQADVVIRGVR